MSVDAKSNNNVEKTISSIQIRKLKEEVGKITKVRSEIMIIWKDFKFHFELHRYIHLPKYKFNKAIKWIKNYKFNM